MRFHISSGNDNFSLSLIGSFVGRTGALSFNERAYTQDRLAGP